MAFGVPYQPGYMPNYYPMGQQMPSAMPDQLAQLRQAAYPQQQPTAQQTAPIIWVQGEEGAKAYMVAAGNSVLLMDSENSTFYIKSTDASGMPQPLRVFDYSERTASQKQPTHTAQKPKEEYVTRQEFNALTARFDALTADKPLTRKKIEQTSTYMAPRGMDCTKEEFYAAMNMMFSDYYPAAKKHNVNMAEFYADLAAAFINDKDASKNKVEKYYECVVE